MLTENKIWMATSNAHKIKEAAQVLASYNIKLEHYPLDRVEIQSDDPAEIAAYSLNMVKEEIPLCVEDTGVFIDNLNGFPGPYSSYVLERIGNPGILKLMEGVKDRKARYISALAFRDKSKIHIFRGVVEGNIAFSIRGTNGFGYDPIFIPNEGNGHTFGEMSDFEKNDISHRARAFTALAEWLTNKHVNNRNESLNSV